MLFAILIDISLNGNDEGERKFLPLAKDSVSFGILHTHSHKINLSHIDDGACDL